MANEQPKNLAAQPAWVIALVLFGAALAFTLVIGACFLIHRHFVPISPQLTRDTFPTAVMGKTPAEVITVAGRPTSTDPAAKNKIKGMRWSYINHVLDPISRKMIYCMTIEFSTTEPPRVIDVRESIF